MHDGKFYGKGHQEINDPPLAGAGGILAKKNN
jgi:hypothetical protein